MARGEQIEVVAAALLDAAGRILIARRAADKHQGGLWEFPGGKREHGETISAALERELVEELDIRPVRHRPLIRLRHDYDDRSVVLDVHRVEAFEGDPRGVEGQPLRWVSAEELAEVAMPPADRPIVRALQLPDRYLITGAAVDEVDFELRLRRALEQGVSLVQLRSRLTGQALLRRARGALALCRRYGARLLLNAEPDLLETVPADGLHLSAGRLRTLPARPPAAALLAASCHDAEELDHAQRLGADFAVLSPVCPTRSHPGVSPLGWPAFNRLVGDRPLPVYALGGVGPRDLERAWSAGAQGVAAISALWPQEDSG